MNADAHGSGTRSVCIRVHLWLWWIRGSSFHGGPRAGILAVGEESHLGIRLMRTLLATAVLVALVLSAAGQPPAGQKAPPPAGGKMPAVPKAGTPGTPGAPPAAPKDQPAVEYPTEIAGRNLDQWIKDIDSLDPSIRTLAIRTVPNFGPSCKRAIPAVIRQITKFDNDLSPRSNAIVILPILVSADPQNYYKPAVDALSLALDSSQGIIKFQAAAALAQFGPYARATVPKLAKLVEDRASGEIRQAAAAALSAVARDDNGWPDMRALNALMHGIDDGSKEVRMECLQAIINLGPPASGEVAAYRNLLEKRLKADKDKTCTIWVRVAMMRLDAALVTDTHLSAISKLMKGQESEVRIQAARALGFIGIYAKSQIPALIDALKDDEPLMVWQVCLSLGRMEKESEKALPMLQAIADNHRDQAVKEEAKKAVEAIKKAIEGDKKPPEKK